MKKNVAGQTVGAQLISKTDGTAVTTGSTEVYVTGDAGTQTASSGSPSGAVHEGQGYWSFMPTQAETNYDHVAFTFVNSSAVNVTVQIYTSFPQTGDNFTRLGAPAGASVSADIAAVKAGDDLIKANTDKLGDTFVADGSPGNYRFSTNALSGVWDSQRGGHALAGSFGEGVASVQGNVTGSVASVTGAVGSVTGNVGGNVTGSVGSVASGGIAASSFAAGAIDAAAIATDAIDADSIKADAVTEIQSGLSTLTAAGVRTAVGLASANLDTQLSGISAVTAKLDTTLQTGSPVNDYIFSAAALALGPTGTGASAATIADAVWDELRSGHVGAGSFGEGVEVATKTGFRLSASGVDDIHDEVVDGTTTFRESTRLHNAALGGKASGLATTSVLYRDLADSKDRISATVDGDGNRSAVTLDLNP